MPCVARGALVAARHFITFALLSSVAAMRAMLAGHGRFTERRLNARRCQRWHRIDIDAGAPTYAAAEGI